MDAHQDYLIDQYLRGALTLEEKVQFQQLLQNPTFLSELQFRQGVQRASREMGRKQLKKRLQFLEKQPTTPKKYSQRFSQLNWWGRAAALVLLGFWGIRTYYTTPSETSLVNEYLEPYPNVIAPLVRSHQQPSELEKALHLFEQKSFQEALLKLKKLPPSPERDFYLAQSYLYTNSPRNAPVLLQPLALQSGLFQLPAQWYLALSHLANGNKKAAIIQLKAISTASNHPYQTKSNKLLQRLQ